MNRLNCPKCDNHLYTAAIETRMACPHCGHTLSAESDRRNKNRMMTQKICDLLKGDVKVPVKTVDISDTGMGIKMMGYLPFDKNETVNVYIEELELEKRAQVVWTKNFYGISRAGLRFY